MEIYTMFRWEVEGTDEGQSQIEQPRRRAEFNSGTHKIDLGNFTENTICELSIVKRNVKKEPWIP